MHVHHTAESVPSHFDADGWDTPALSNSFELVKKDVGLRAEHLSFGDGPAHVRIAEVVPTMHKRETNTVLESNGYGVRKQSLWF
jgi:hypothetical protein